MPQPSDFLIGGQGAPGGGPPPAGLEARVQALETTPTLPTRVTTLETTRALQADLTAAVSRIAMLEATASQAVTPNTADGKPLSQIGPQGITYYSPADVFLNEYYNQGLANVRLPGGASATPAQLLTSGVLDANTLLPKALTGGGLTFADAILGLCRWGATVRPDDYNASTWVLEAVGADQLFLPPTGTGARTRTVNTPNRQEYTFSAPTVEGQPIFDQTPTTARAAGGIRFFRLSDEPRLLQGKTFRQRTVDLYKRHKILRPMDWTGSPIAGNRSVDGLKRKSCGFRATDPGFHLFMRSNTPINGVPTEEILELSMETDTALWYTFPLWIGAGNGFCDIIEVGGFGFQDFNPTKWAEIQAYTNANRAAIVASPEWQRYTDHLAAALNAANYPRKRVVYIEIPNEPWNDFTAWVAVYCRGISQSFGQPATFAYGMGYLTARLAHAFNTSLIAAGRADQEYRICFNVQAVGTGQNALVRAGFERYFADNSIALAPYKARAGGVIAPYINGYYDKTVGAIPGGPFADDAARNTAWAAAIASNASGLMDTVRDWIINSAATVGECIPYLKAKTQEHKTDWEGAGYKLFGCYEGGLHGLLGGGAESNATIRTWHNQFLASPQAAAVTSAYLAALLQVDPQLILANFGDVGWGTAASTASPPIANAPWLGPYYDQLTLGEWAGWNTYLRPAA